MNDSTIECYESIFNQRSKELIENGLALEELNNYDNYEDIFTKDVFRLLMNRKSNRRHKRNRVKKKYIELYKLYEKIGKGSIYFGTLTLSDKYLNLKENTYIRYIHKWLKRHFVYVILNKDYGSKTEREHYHFIGLTTEEVESKGSRSKKGYEILELKKKDYEIGFEPTLCKIDLKKDDLDKTINYLLKLNNHSTKITTKNRIRIIKNDFVDLLFYKSKE